MVHKRYIKKNGVLMGPYYYESYRENGRVKKRYLGTVHPDEKAKLEKVKAEQQYRFTMPSFNIKFIFWIISILFVILIAVTLFLSFEGVRSLLGLETEAVYNLGDNLGGKAVITLQIGDYIPAGTMIDVSLFKEGILTYKKSESVDEFFRGKLESRDLSDTRVVCDTQNQFCHNETISLGKVFSTPGAYDVNLGDLLNYTLDKSGNYEILFSISSLNLFTSKKFSVLTGPNGETSLKTNPDLVKTNESVATNISNIQKNNTLIQNGTISNGTVSGAGSGSFCSTCSNIEGNLNSPIYSHCSYSSCYGGSRIKTCTDGSEAVLRESVPCISDCFSDFQCESWSECASGVSFRDCIDLNQCSAQVRETKDCSSSGCRSNVKCAEWGSCSYDTKTEDIINGVISKFGKQQRLCSDLNGCVPSYVEQKDCNLSMDISLSRERDPCNSSNYLIRAFNKQTNEPVLDINSQRWAETGRLNINFVQNSTIYCSTCYNSVVDSSEQGIDCGGICKPCSAPRTKISFGAIGLNFIIALIILLSVAFILIILSIFAERDELREIRKMIKSGRVFLTANDKDNARVIYKKVQEKYALLNPEKQKEIKSDILNYHSDLIGFKVPD